MMELEKAAHAPAAHQSTTLEGKSQEDRDKEPEERIRRTEQDMIDRIMRGEEKGHYYLLLGPKGSGKTSMMIQAVCHVLDRRNPRFFGILTVWCSALSNR